MSDYRVLDAHKNIYDATVMSSLFVDDVPKGFDVSVKVTGNGDEDYPTYLNGEVTITSLRQNPAGGKYISKPNSGDSDFDFEIIAENPSASVYSQLFIYRDSIVSSSSITYSLVFKNDTDFNIRVYNLDIDNNLPSEGQHSYPALGGNAIINVSYSEGYSPDDISSFSKEISPHSQEIFQIIMNREIIISSFAGRADWYMNFYSFYIQRIF